MTIEPLRAPEPATERCAVPLDGCRPTPLAHYLKGLAVLRLVSEQADADARGCWDGETFVLDCAFDSEQLERFFLERYQPTPIIAPWNGGSGFYAKDNTTAIEAIAASSAPRFSRYREVVELARAVLAALGVDDKASGTEKAELLRACRARFPDSVLDWLDAAFALTAGGPKYPPLLGTGGNDGRLEFTNNYMQRLVALFDVNSDAPQPATRSLLRSSLFGEPTDQLLSKAAIGQFLPASAGGANAQSGFDAESLTNPWDFVLMLEGALAFAGAAARRLERETFGGLAYPFTVHQVGAGYGSAASQDESDARAEIWMPLWRRPTRYCEVRALLAEGRARVGRRSATNGVDFARAVATLGVDRGIDGFQRYGFQVRNGLSYLATPLGRLPVRASATAALLQPIDSWLDRLGQAARGRGAPASVARAVRRLDETILALCLRDDVMRRQAVLVALGGCERALSHSLRWSQEAFVKPLPGLDPLWIEACDDGTAEYRLAAALGSLTRKQTPRAPDASESEDRRGSPPQPRWVPLRCQLEPVTTGWRRKELEAEWAPEASREVGWRAGSVPSALGAIFSRRLVLAAQGGMSLTREREHPAEAGGVPETGTTYMDTARVTASLADIATFIEGPFDDRRFAELLWGCALVDWTRSYERSALSRPSDAAGPLPGLLYGVLKLCFASWPVKAPSDSGAPPVWVPLDARIHRLAAAGRGGQASRLAARRLRASGLPPAASGARTDVPIAHLEGEAARRAAAAVLFPLGRTEIDRLAARVLRRQDIS